MRRLAIVAVIPLLLWGVLEATRLLKVRAPGVPQGLTNPAGIPAQPAPPESLRQPATAPQESPEPQKIASDPSPVSRRLVWRTTVQATLSELMQMEAAIQKYSQAYGVDENLVWAVIRRESGFNPAAVSPKGALGLMQLMPGTAALMGVSNPFDPEQNIAGGIKYLVLCLKQFHGDIGLALAAYNAGPENVAKYQGCPPFSETIQYVAAVLQDFAGAPRVRIFELSSTDPAWLGEIAATRAGSGLHWNLPLPSLKTPTPVWRIAPPRWKVFSDQAQTQTSAAQSAVQPPTLR